MGSAAGDPAMVRRRWWGLREVARSSGWGQAWGQAWGRRAKPEIPSRERAGGTSGVAYDLVFPGFLCAQVTCVNNSDSKTH